MCPWVKGGCGTGKSTMELEDLKLSCHLFLVQLETIHQISLYVFPYW